MGKNKKTKDQKTGEGALSFEQFYQQQFQERWPLLSRSLTADPEQIARPNLFLDSNRGSSAHQLSLSELSSKKIQAQASVEIPRDLDSGLLSYYVMDPASLWPAVALQVKPGMRVLDMCAAPGGKTLALAEQLFLSGQREQSAELLQDSQLIANEPSEARRDRLTKVLRQYIPEHFRKQCRVTGKDGGLFAHKESASFDRILVDAPCSGERHLLENKTQLEEWSVQRSKGLAQRQYALLTAALICLKPLGRLVYSTCALSPFENDQVIQRLLKKKEGFQVIPAREWVSLSQESPWQLPPVEITEFGAMILPDQSGYGPIYLSVIQKDSDSV